MKLNCLIFIFLAGLVCSVKKINVLDYGAKGDGVTLDTKSLQNALDSCEHGSCEVLFPKKNLEGNDAKYYSGSLVVYADQRIILEGDLIGSKNIEDYPIITGPDPYRGQRYRPLIYGVSVDNLVITGYGLMYGNGQYFWPEFPYPEISERPEIELAKTLSTSTLRSPPRVVELFHGENVIIENISVENSPFWTIWPNFLNNFIIRNIRIHNPIDSPNTDCLDPTSCTNGIITNCSLYCGDDSVTIKAYETLNFREKFSGIRNLYKTTSSDKKKKELRKLAYPYRSENITISNCEFLPGQGMTIGAGTYGGIFDITFENNIMRGGLVGMRFKQVRDEGGYIENIIYRNNEYRTTGILFSLNMDFTHHPPAKNSTLVPTVKNIRVEGIKAWGISSVEITCLPESPCIDMVFKDLIWVVCKDWAPCDFANGTVTNYIKGPPICPSFKLMN